MSQHDENMEVDLIKSIRRGWDTGDNETSNRLFEDLKRLYEEDARQLAKRFSKGEIVQGNLAGYFLASLISPIRNYDYEAYDSFCLYVLRGWKGYVVKQYRRQNRVSGLSLDVDLSQDGKSTRYSDIVPDPRECQDRSDGTDLFEWLCRQFKVSAPEKKMALRDTIIGEANPLQRRVGFSILSRRIEHQPSISRFWVSRFWVDAATRRKLWKELAEPPVTPD